ncbi:MAG: DNA polymerase III subunit delta' [Acidobacteriota bacterium]|jgi:DNA polymerase-3 subunit delta'
MSFEGIVGQDRALDALRRGLDEDRLHPSLLFHGPDGVGKRLTAFHLAAALNCLAAPGTGCGECPSCLRIERGYGENRLRRPDQKRAPGHHADVLYYPPRRRQILIEQVQDLIREAGFRPFEGRRRVFILDPADRMNREAANALLKTLEEPPPSVCLVLLSASPDALPATIRSRCQAMRFVPLAPPDLARLLVDRGQPPEEAARRARLAGGSVGAALALDLEAHDRIREAGLTMLEAAGRPQGLLHALGLAATAGSDAETFRFAADLLVSLFRDLALLHEDAPDDALVHADVAPRLRGLAARLGPDAPGIIDRLEEAVRRIRGNVNPRLAAEAVLVPLVQAGG